MLPSSLVHARLRHQANTETNQTGKKRNPGSHKRFEVECEEKDVEIIARGYELEYKNGRNEKKGEVKHGGEDGNKNGNEDFINIKGVS
jgi:hypothetical protein